LNRACDRAVVYRFEPAGGVEEEDAGGDGADDEVAGHEVDAVAGQRVVDGRSDTEHAIDEHHGGLLARRLFGCAGGEFNCRWWIPAGQAGTGTELPASTLFSRTLRKIRRARISSIHHVSRRAPQVADTEGRLQFCCRVGFCKLGE
jgi:hypothetical protein